jgi:hypothetical protein
VSFLFITFYDHNNNYNITDNSDMGENEYEQNRVVGFQTMGVNLIKVGGRQLMSKINKKVKQIKKTDS